MKLVDFKTADAVCGGALSTSFKGGYESVLLIEGALTLEGGDCEIYIGAGKFDYLVYGYYNDGILEAGEVEVPWVINSDHHLCVSAPGAIKIDNYSDNCDYDFGRENINRSFVSEVLDSDTENKIDIESFYTRLKAGKPVLCEGAMTAEQTTLAEVETAFTSRALHLNLRGRKLKRFPERICEMTWLRTLDLGNNKIGEVPEGIGALGELEQLHIDKCGLGSLPAAIGKLKKLRVLSIAWNGRVSDPIKLPDSFTALEALEELDVSDLSESANLFVADIGRFKNLRKVDLAYNGLTTLPESFYTLTHLEEVDLRYNALRRAERERIAESFPKTKIDFDFQRFPEGDEER